MSSDQNKRLSDEFNLHVLTEFERRQFTICGLYPLKNPSIKDTLKHHIKFIILVIFSSILFLSMTIALILGVDNLSDVTAILYYLITQSAYLIKLVNWMIQRWKLPLLEAHLDAESPYKYYNIYGHANLDSIVDICVFTGRVFRISVTVVLVFYIMVPLVNEDILLPFAGWMPVDKAQYRIVIFMVQISCFVVSAYTNSSFDIFAAYYMSIGVGHLRLLKTCLANIDYTTAGNLNHEENRRIKHESGYNENNKERKHERKLIATSLDELVKMHKHVISYIALMESTFSYGIFVQFLASVCVICLTGFQMLVVSPASAEFILLMFYFICMMCQVVLYCWYGNEVLFESEGIIEACYMSNWYDAPKSLKQNIFLVMERSKRQIILTAGKFFILSLPTLVMIVKSAYSYFAVLRRMYQED